MAFSPMSSLIQYRMKNQAVSEIQENLTGAWESDRQAMPVK